MAEQSSADGAYPHEPIPEVGAGPDAPHESGADFDPFGSFWPEVEGAENVGEEEMFGGFEPDDVAAAPMGFRPSRLVFSLIAVVAALVLVGVCALGGVLGGGSKKSPGAPPQTSTARQPVTSASSKEDGDSDKKKDAEDKPADDAEGKEDAEDAQAAEQDEPQEVEQDDEEEAYVPSTCWNCGGSGSVQTGSYTVTDSNAWDEYVVDSDAYDEEVPVMEDVTYWVDADGNPADPGAEGASLVTVQVQTGTTVVHHEEQGHYVHHDAVTHTEYIYGTCSVCDGSGVV